MPATADQSQYLGDVTYFTSFAITAAGVLDSSNGEVSDTERCPPDVAPLRGFGDVLGGHRVTAVSTVGLSLRRGLPVSCQCRNVPLQQPIARWPVAPRQAVGRPWGGMVIAVAKTIEGCQKRVRVPLEERGAPPMEAVGRVTDTASPARRHGVDVVDTGRRRPDRSARPSTPPPAMPPHRSSPNTDQGAAPRAG